MANTQKINRVDISNIEAINRVSGSNIEQLDGQGFVTFTAASYTFNSTNNSWAVPGGTTHMDITVIGGGARGWANQNYAGFGGGGSGASQSTENTGGRTAIGNITNLAIVIGAAGAYWGAAGASTVNGNGLTEIAGNGGYMPDGSWTAYSWGGGPRAAGGTGAGGNTSTNGGQGGYPRYGGGEGFSGNAGACGGGGGGDASTNTAGAAGGGGNIGGAGGAGGDGSYSNANVPSWGADGVFPGGGGGGRGAGWGSRSGSPGSNNVDALGSAGRVVINTRSGSTGNT